MSADTMTRPDAPPAPPTANRHEPQWRAVPRLTLLELRLMLREPMVIIGLLGLPLIAMIVIGGVFGQTPDPEFGGVPPDDYYVASYLGVVVASLGLVTLPAHIATSRELGVTRRYRASGLSAGTIVATQLSLGLVLGLTASAVVVATGHAVYDLQAPDQLGAVLAWFALGLVCHIAIGGALGLMVKTGRAANALGSALFLPALLLGGGGPPRDVMSDAMRSVADLLPLSHITAGMRRDWLGTTDGNVVVWWPLLVAVSSVAVALWLTRRRMD
jgi:ABC-2 type transport system permease protein